MQNIRPVMVDSLEHPSTIDNMRHHLQDIGFFIFLTTNAGGHDDCVMTTASYGLKPTTVPCVDITMIVYMEAQQPLPGFLIPVSDMTSKLYGLLLFQYHLFISLVPLILHLYLQSLDLLFLLLFTLASILQKFARMYVRDDLF